MTLVKFVRALSGGLIDPGGPLTERSWNTCSDPLRLLDHVEDTNCLDLQKLRAFISECGWVSIHPDEPFCEKFVAARVIEERLRGLSRWSRRYYQARSELANTLRCIFGSPFRPLVCNREWKTRETQTLATIIDQERAFDRLPILADALEDAGCDHADILNHCRQPGKHVRGCWVVDLLLGKE